MSALLPSLLRILGAVMGLYLVLGGVVFLAQRSLLYHPTHRVVATGMERWIQAGEYWGHKREVSDPTGVWLILHGNGGQAAHRDYLVEQVVDDTAVFVLEYPGYGERPGRTTEQTINAAAALTWQHLRARFLPGPANWRHG